MTPDPKPASNALGIPQNWDRYAYVGGDPANKTDPEGLCSPQDDPPCYSVTGTGDGSIGDGSWGSEYGGVGSFETSSPMVPIPTEGLVSVFSITATAFKLAVPLVANANSNKQNIFKKAFNTAYNLLKSPKCDSAFGTGRPGNALQGLLQNANYVYSNVTSQGPIPSDDVAVTAPLGNTVTINSGATTNFFGTSANGVAVQGDALSLNDFRAFVLLHELGHMVGFGNLWDSDSSEQELLKDCFGLQ